MYKGYVKRYEKGREENERGMGSGGRICNPIILIPQGLNENSDIPH